MVTGFRSDRCGHKVKLINETKADFTVFVKLLPSLICTGNGKKNSNFLVLYVPRL